MAPLLPQLDSPDSETVRLILLRHGEVNAEDRKNLYGQADVRLSDLGVLQSQKTGEALSTLAVDAVYTSDLSRAFILATEVARHQQLAPSVTPVLRERSFGDWQGLTWEQIADRDPDLLDEYRKNRHTVRAPQGESFVDLRERVTPFIAEMVLLHQGQTVVIAAHSGPVRIILAHALGLPLESLFTFDQDYCCLNIVDFRSTTEARVRVLNSTLHLETLAKRDGFVP